MLDQIHIHTMQPLVGQEFELSDFAEDHARLTLTAVEVREDNQEFENFSLIFSGPEQPFLPQSIYRLNHPTLQPFEIFLVPIARSGQTYLYEAVFNLINKPSA
jgi:hypothetical protein